MRSVLACALRAPSRTMTETTIVPGTVLGWRPLAEKYAAIYPPLTAEEILAIIWSESTGNPNAINPKDPSWGLMQITLPIAKAFGMVTDYRKLFDPETNVRIGAAFLAHLKKSHAAAFPLTDTNCAWPAAYNEGEPNESKHVPDP